MKTYHGIGTTSFSHTVTQVLDDIEDERVRQGKKRRVLNSTLPYPKIVEDISQVWEKEFSERRK